MIQWMADRQHAHDRLKRGWHSIHLNFEPCYICHCLLLLDHKHHLLTNFPLMHIWKPPHPHHVLNHFPLGHEWQPPHSPRLYHHYCVRDPTYSPWTWNIYKKLNNGTYTIRSLAFFFFFLAGEKKISARPARRSVQCGSAAAHVSEGQPSARGRLFGHTSEGQSSGAAASLASGCCSARLGPRGCFVRLIKAKAHLSFGSCELRQPHG